jgi:hypothetical protein
MKPLYNFANTLASQIDKARTTNLNEYSHENGYDQEFQEKQQWTTPNIY